jgi:dethiobiotin synthetase
MTSDVQLKGCFVTGTDTGVGKTRLSAGLLQLLQRRGLVVAGFKPVAAGIECVGGERFNEDVRTLRQAGSPGFSDDDVGPLQLDPLQLDLACAPHIAAEAQGLVIDRDALVQAARALQRRADALVVEGVGGFVVPLAPGWDTSHLACALGLPVILVVGLRLGCLNHALLTAEAMRTRHLRIAGWVGSVIDPDMIELEANIATLHTELARRHGAGCLGVVPWLHEPTPQHVADHLDAEAIFDVLDLQPQLHLVSNA